MNFNEFKIAAAEAAKSDGITDYELYYEASESTSVSAFKHEVSSFSASLDGGVSFRCIVDGKMGYASTEELSEEEAKRVVKRAAGNAKALESEEKPFLREGGGVYKEPMVKDFPIPTDSDITDCALNALEAVYAADKTVIDGSESGAGSETVKLAIYNSKGLDLEYSNGFSYLLVAPIVTDGNEMKDNFEVRIGQLSKLDADEIAGEAVEKAKSMLGADVAPTGAYPVVFSPDAMSALLRTFSPVFSSENTRKGLSLFAGCEGKQVASEAVTLVDDPFYKDSPLPIGFDAEGSPAYTKNVIEKGKLVTLLYNMKTAAAEGRETTGNGSRRSYNSPVEISPFTMYIAPGEYTEEELFGKAGNGVYITSLGGLHAGANVISGDFSLQSSGYMIEDGKKTRPVTSFTVAGNFYTLLKGITAVANEIKFKGFGGLTTFLSPSALVEGLTIAGK